MFAQRFKEFLKENNISAYALSKAVGIPQTTISNWISRGSKPNIDDIVKICDYFSVSVDYLIGRESEDGIIMVDGNENFTPEELNLIKLYRRLNSKKKDSVIDFIKWQLS